MPRKKKDEIDDFKFDEKKAKKEIDALLNEKLEEAHAEAAQEDITKDPKEKPIKKENPKLDLSNLEMSEEQLMEEIRIESEMINEFTHEEMAEWLLSLHNEYVSAMNHAIAPEFLDGETFEDKYYITFYMYSILLYLSTRGIEHLDRKVGEILEEKNEPELLSILNVLGYL